MTTSASRRGNFFGKENLTAYDAPKSSYKDILNEKSSKYDQENSLHGHKNGSAAAIPDTFVGYSDIPNHAVRRAVRQGFDFNLMIIGQAGLGKSTFVNTLFLTDIYGTDYPGPSGVSTDKVQVRTTKVLLQEEGVSLRLSVIDTPGFGECIDNTNCWKPIVDYIDARFDDYMAAEGRVTRDTRKIVDSRVHVCLYFLAPTGHRLRSLDIECLKRIQDRVNIIPVIGKADCMTPEECKEFKKNVVDDLKRYQIKIYEFSDCDKNTGEVKLDVERSRMRTLRERVPFAVVGANTCITSGAGTRVRARAYPWGTVEVDNIEHNDFSVLSYHLVQLQMQDLREVTHRRHYENYRANKLSQIAEGSNFKTVDGQDPMMIMDAEKREHEQKLRKMEADMEAVFAQKVAEKSAKQAELEAELVRRAEQMREALRHEETALEAERKAFEEARTRWNEAETAQHLSSGGSDLGDGLGSGGLGERVLSEVIKERSKTEKKRKGLF